MSTIETTGIAIRRGDTIIDFVNAQDLLKTLADGPRVADGGEIGTAVLVLLDIDHVATHEVRAQQESGEPVGVDKLDQAIALLTEVRDALAVQASA